MIKSTPPAASNLAEMPVPAPPPIIGRPSAMTARNRLRTCSLVKAIRKIRTEKSHAKAQSRKEKTGLQVPSSAKRFSVDRPSDEMESFIPLRLGVLASDFIFGLARASS